VVALVGAALLIPVGGSSATSIPVGGGAVPAPDPALSDAAPKKPLSLLFIHHSVGGRWLADAGPKQPIANEVWKAHPNGGGLRSRLEAQGYHVDEASYGSPLGDKTDDGDWLPKFRDHFDQMSGHAIVVFKSCFPNNLLDDDAALQKAKARLTELLPIFAQHPDTLFVKVTTPPLAPRTEKEPAWKYLARMVLGKPQPGPRLERSGPRARALDAWVTSPDGWLKGYPHKNVAVFDFYEVLTDHGKSNFLAFVGEDGTDSHPSRAGNERATAEFVPFLNRAVRRAGLAE